MSDMTFDAQAHVYTVGGRVYPGITQVLRDVGLIDTKHFTPGAADRGTSAHEAIKLIEQGVMNPEDFEGDTRGYVDAWVDFKRVSKPKILGSEVPAYDAVYGYATHIDLVLEVAGKRTVADIKTGALKAWHGLQLAGAGLLMNAPERFVLQLGADGKFKCHFEWQKTRFSDKSWDKAFLSAVTLYHWRRNMGIAA
jgi:hypothetical protein